MSLGTSAVAATAGTSTGERGTSPLAPGGGALRVLVVAAGIVAAWGATRWAFGLPVLWLGAAVGWLALPLGQRRGLSASWLVPLGLVLVVGLGVALDLELAVRHTTNLLLAVLLFGLARLAALGEGEVRWLAVGIAATAILAFLQAAGGLSEALTGVEALPPGLQELAARRLSGGRAFGSSALPGHFAALLVTTTPLLWRWAGESPGPPRLVPLSALAGVALALYLTRSLAALAVAALLLLLLLLRRGRRPAVGIGAAVLAALLLAVVASRGDLGTLKPVQLRLVNWRVTGWVALHHPWVGVGLGGVGQGGLLSPWAAGNITPYAHNTPLQLVAETGLAGVPLLVLGVGALLRLLHRGAARDGALAAAVAVVPLHNLVDFSLYAPEVLLPWAILAGTLAARAAPLPARSLPSGVLVPLLVAGSIVAALEWQAETAFQRALAAPGTGVASAAVAAAVWAPWQVRPLYAAVELALSPPTSAVEQQRVEEALGRRHWVQPRSAGWAEARARLLLAQGRRGEALVWAREARRRAPARGELAALEELCR